MSKKVNAQNTQNTQNTQNANNRNEVVTMNKNENTKAKTEISVRDKMNNARVSTINSFKAKLLEAKARGIKPTEYVTNELHNLELATSAVRIKRASFYYYVKNSSEIAKDFGVSTIADFITKYETEDSKATASEMTKVYKFFYAEPSDKIRKFMSAYNYTYTELVKIASANRGGKGVKLSDEETAKEIEDFLTKYTDDKNEPIWSKVSELREYIKDFNEAIEATSKDTKPKGEPKTEAKTEAKTEPKNDYTAIKSVADTSKKDATSAIKQAKADGDIIENKAKGVTIVNAESVSDFMTKLVNIAKIRGCKPLELIGNITMTIKDGE